MKTIDWYIIKKFLGTYFFSIILILSISVVFDITEKMDDFIEEQVPVREIIFDYYVNFVPYYLNMFSQLFIFISVIFFTSKLAGNSEIIAIFASGVSYHRFMVPYIVSAFVLFGFTLWLGGYVIPKASHNLIQFEWRYIKNGSVDHARNIQLEVQPGMILYIESFQRRNQMGYRASLENFDGKSLASRITAERIYYDSLYNWHLENYTKRTFDGLYEYLSTGERLDTIIAVNSDELFINAECAQEMTNTELSNYIRRQQERGSGNIKAFITEWWKRFASPVGAFIMTLLGVTLSSRKVRGGMGKNLGIGITLAALYILFSTVSTTFSVTGVMSPFMAVWLPNIVFLVIGVLLYMRVSR